MIEVPPLETPSVQVIPIYVALVTATLFAKLIGAFGTRSITPPLPEPDYALAP